MSNASEDTSNSRTHEPSFRELVSELDGLRELVLSKFQAIRELIDERDRLYKERDAAIREQTRASLESNEKAVTKAEDAQREYNIRSNEFRGQLDDQNKLMRDTMMPRVESLSMHHATADKIELVKGELYRQADSITENFDKEIERLSDDIKVLRESNAAQSGKSSGRHGMWGYVIAAIGLIGMLVTTGIALIKLGAKP